jgi:(p)ppGpp synthase/HD superfamily hydrolase
MTSRPPRTFRPLWHEAAALAARAHLHQIRKDGRTPYATHPGRVAMIIASIFGVTDESILAAAYLHDVIEDTGADYDDVHDRFGRDVADYVAAMTKDMRRREPERERAYDEQLAEGPWQGRLIKLADVYDNLCDAETAADRRTLLERADRAVRLCDGEERLAGPRERVVALMEAVRADLDDE